jgi:hypothetical protein
VTAPSGPEDVSGNSDPFRQARAYHLSVYLMVGMPYLCLGVVGYLIYRAVNQKARAEQLNADLIRAGGEGTEPCPNLSRGDIS